MTLRGTEFARLRLVAVLLSAGSLIAVAGCTSAGGDEPDGAADQSAVADQEPAAAEEDVPDVTVSDNVKRRGVGVDTELELTAENGTLKRVRVVARSTEESGRLPGALNDDGTAWTADELLEPGAKYVVRTVAADEDGQVKRDTSTFRTDDLTLDEQTYPSIAPLQGDTVGVGMPVIVSFDIPVKNKAAFERRLEVESTPQVQGTWHWYSDTEVHFRPKNLWKPGTKVTVNANVNGVDAGNGIYGQLSRKVSYTIGDKVIQRIHVKHHRLDVFINGKLARQIPVSAGGAGFETRSGTKVVMEKHTVKRMDARTIGINPGDPDYYNIPDVYWAMRVTDSGEFVHGAPWSVGSQGSENVSHGCVGMSLDDAKWLYDRSQIGDIVRVSGTDRTIEYDNGWTDWNVSYAEFKKGSALS
jgi:lipoprotein-anchoring transpeptidase ErfK/SrfK